MYMPGIIPSLITFGIGSTTRCATWDEHEWLTNKLGIYCTVYAVTEYAWCEPGVPAWFAMSPDDAWVTTLLDPPTFKVEEESFMRSPLTDRLGKQLNAAFNKSNMTALEFGHYLEQTRDIFDLNETEDTLSFHVVIDGVVYQFYYSFNVYTWYCKC